MKNTLFNKVFGGISKDAKLWFHDDKGKDSLVSDDPVLMNSITVDKKELKKIYPPKDEELDEGTKIG